MVDTHDNESGPSGPRGLPRLSSEPTIVLLWDVTIETFVHSDADGVYQRLYGYPVPEAAKESYTEPTKTSEIARFDTETGTFHTGSSGSTRYKVATCATCHHRPMALRSLGSESFIATVRHLVEEDHEHGLRILDGSPRTWVASEMDVVSIDSIVPPTPDNQNMPVMEPWKRGTHCPDLFEYKSLDDTIHMARECMSTNMRLARNAVFPPMTEEQQVLQRCAQLLATTDRLGEIVHTIGSGIRERQYIPKDNTPLPPLLVAEIITWFGSLQCLKYSDLDSRASALPRMIAATAFLFQIQELLEMTDTSQSETVPESVLHGATDTLVSLLSDAVQLASAHINKDNVVTDVFKMTYMQVVARTVDLMKKHGTGMDLRSSLWRYKDGHAPVLTLFQTVLQHPCGTMYFVRRVSGYPYVHQAAMWALLRLIHEGPAVTGMAVSLDSLVTDLSPGNGFCELFDTGKYLTEGLNGTLDEIMRGAYESDGARRGAMEVVECLLLCRPDKVQFDIAMYKAYAGAAKATYRLYDDTNTVQAFVYRAMQVWRNKIATTRIELQKLKSEYPLLCDIYTKDLEGAAEGVPPPPAMSKQGEDPSLDSRDRPAPVRLSPGYDGDVSENEQSPAGHVGATRVIGKDRPPRPRQGPVHRLVKQLSAKYGAVNHTGAGEA